MAAAGAVALALAFPKINAAWLAPCGAAALFWTWQHASWKRAFALGWFAGIIFFAISFSWFSQTVGAYVGIFAPAVVIVPAILEGFAFACAGALASIAFRLASPALAPLAAACAFVVFEWLRSIGVMGTPFAQLGYSQADTPLVVLAAYIGTYGITLVICALGAYAADALARRTIRPLALVIAVIAIATPICWQWWPARTLAPPTTRVVAAQGNIAQSLKWTPQALQLAIDRYTALTKQTDAADPALIVWPETVISTVLNYQPQLMDRFGALARDAHATLVVGSLYAVGSTEYNALYFFSPDGSLEGVYEKRQLVPFAETFPGRAFLSWLPYATSLISNFGSGAFDTVYATPAGTAAPLICWESAFADLAQAQVHAGATLLVVSTDDAWFGTTAGPYQHAQIAQLRAVETGRYVVRAAATGISGIIAPNGRYTARSKLDTLQVIDGMIGQPVDTVFNHIGPTKIAVILAMLYVLIVVFLRRRHA